MLQPTSSSSIVLNSGSQQLNGTKVAGEYDTILTGEIPDVYESLDSLKFASSALMPPFKTVRVQKERSTLKKSCVSTTITQTPNGSVTTVNANELSLVNVNCGIGELIPENDHVAIVPSSLKKQDSL